MSNKGPRLDWEVKDDGDLPDLGDPRQSRTHKGDPHDHQEIDTTGSQAGDSEGGQGGLSRRDFLRGAAVIAVSAVAGAAAAKGLSSPETLEDDFLSQMERAKRRLIDNNLSQLIPTLERIMFWEDVTHGRNFVLNRVQEGLINVGFRNEEPEGTLKRIAKPRTSVTIQVPEIAYPVAHSEVIELAASKVAKDPALIVFEDEFRDKIPDELKTTSLQDTNPGLALLVGKLATNVHTAEQYRDYWERQSTTFRDNGTEKQLLQSMLTTFGPEVIIEVMAPYVNSETLVNFINAVSEQHTKELYAFATQRGYDVTRHPFALAFRHIIAGSDENYGSEGLEDFNRSVALALYKNTIPTDEQTDSIMYSDYQRMLILVIRNLGINENSDEELKMLLGENATRDAKQISVLLAHYYIKAVADAQLRGDYEMLTNIAKNPDLQNLGNLISEAAVFNTDSDQNYLTEAANAFINGGFARHVWDTETSTVLGFTEILKRQHIETLEEQTHLLISFLGLEYEGVLRFDENGNPIVISKREPQGEVPEEDITYLANQDFKGWFVYDIQTTSGKTATILHSIPPAYSNYAFELKLLLPDGDSIDLNQLKGDGNTLHIEYESEEVKLYNMNFNGAPRTLSTSLSQYASANLEVNGEPRVVMFDYSGNALDRYKTFPHIIMIDAEIKALLDQAESKGHTVYYKSLEGRGDTNFIIIEDTEGTILKSFLVTAPPELTWLTDKSINLPSISTSEDLINIKGEDIEMVIASPDVSQGLETAIKTLQPLGFTPTKLEVTGSRQVYKSDERLTTFVDIRISFSDGTNTIELPLEVPIETLTITDPSVENGFER